MSLWAFHNLPNCSALNIWIQNVIFLTLLPVILLSVSLGKIYSLQLHNISLYTLISRSHLLQLLTNALCEFIFTGSVYILFLSVCQSHTTKGSSVKVVWVPTRRYISAEHVPRLFKKWGFGEDAWSPSSSAVCVYILITSTNPDLKFNKTFIYFL